MKIWIDDVRQPPESFIPSYVWVRSVNEAKTIIRANKDKTYGPYKIDLIDIDHDAGDWAFDGGDYIKLLDWMEMMNINIPIRIHSMNPVGRENMRAIIRRNGWTEVM